MPYPRHHPHIDAMNLPDPRAGQAPDFLYAVQFASGIVKVGVTWNPRRRVIQLQLGNGRAVRAACAPVRGARHVAEHALLARVATAATVVPGRREFFTGARFDDVALMLVGEGD